MVPEEKHLDLNELSRGTGIPWFTLFHKLTNFPGLGAETVKGAGHRLFSLEVLDNLNRLRTGRSPSDPTGYIHIAEVSSRSAIPLALVRDKIWTHANHYVIERYRQMWFPEQVVDSLKFRYSAWVEGYLESSTRVTLELVDPMLLAAFARHPELLRTLDWRVFERLLSVLLEKMGYEVELQRGTKDGGIDIFALKRDGPFGPHRYLLQAKQWSKAVGIAPVRDLMFLHNQHRITKSCLATTSRFTKGAWKMGEEFKWQLELRDLWRLKEWIDQALSEAPKK